MGNPCIYTLKDGTKLTYDQMREHILDNYEMLSKADMGGGEPPKGESINAESDGDKFKDKGILNSLFKAKNIPEQSKAGFEEQGLKYKTSSQLEAENVAKSIIDEYGVEDAVLLADAQKFDGDVNSLIYAESLNRLAKAEQDAQTASEKIDLAKKFAEIGIKYDEAARKGGRFNAAINYFYKKSPLGIKMIEEAKRAEQFNEFAKKKNQSWKEFFDELVKEPEFEKVFKEEVREELKKERAAARESRKEKVHNIIDKAKDQFKGGALYSTIIPPKLITTALEGMKKAYDAGEKVAEIVQNAIDYISSELGTSWDTEKFRKEWEEKLGGRDKKTDLQLLKERTLRQINELEEQIKTGERKRKEKKEIELDEEAKDLIAKRDKLKELYKDKFGDAESKLSQLDKFRNKLKGLSEKDKDEVIRRSFKQLIENGALEYNDFKKIIADTLGYGELTPEQSKKITDLVNDINLVDDLASKLRSTDRNDAALKKYLDAKKKAERSATELGKIVFNKPDVVNRLLSVMQLNTLGIPSLINNPIFNVFNQSTVRLPRSVIMTAMDYGIYGIGKLMGKNIKPENNVIAAQKEFYKKLALGSGQSIEQLFNGLTNKDYFQKEVYASQIHPLTSMKELWDFAKGKERLTKGQVADKFIQSTVGVPAEIIARVLNIGDKPQRFASEGAQAATFAKNLGLQGIDYKLFMEFPKEEAYRKLRADGLSSEAAMKKAEEIQERIIKEGEESTFQENNLLNDAIMAAIKPFGKPGAAVKALNMPFVKIPLNAFWSVYNLANPEIALMQSAIYGARALKTKSHLDIQQSKKWFAHAVTGMAWMALTGSLAKMGIINAANPQDATKKEREGEQFYEQQNTINVSKLSAYMQGKNPDEVKDGLLVDIKWFGNMGILMGYQASKLEKMTAEQKETGLNFMQDMASNLRYSAIDFMDKGVFANTGSLVTAINKGGSFMDNYLLNLMNMGTNIVQPAAFAQISRAQLPYYSKAKADDFISELKNNMLVRSSVIRDLTGKYPPSKIGIWGDQLMKKDDWLMRLFSISKSNDDNFAQPIYDDYKKTHNTKFFPSSIKPEIEVNGTKVKLNTEETAQLETLIGQERKKLVAPYINDMATFEGSDKKYSELSDEEKINKLGILYNLGYESGKALFTDLHPEYKSANEIEREEEKQRKEEENKEFMSIKKQEIGLK